MDGVRTNLPLLLWIARDAAFKRGETTTGFLAQRLDESVFARGPRRPKRCVLCAGALLADGRAPWRIAGVGIPLRLEHEGGIAELVADAGAEPGSWHLGGDCTGELRARATRPPRACES